MWLSSRIAAHLLCAPGALGAELQTVVTSHSTAGWTQTCCTAHKQVRVVSTDQSPTLEKVCIYGVIFYLLIDMIILICVFILILSSSKCVVQCSKCNIILGFK